MKKAYFAAILYSVLIGFSFLATKVTVTEASAITVLAHRFLLGAICFGVYRIATRTKSTIGLKDLKTLLPLSITYPILYFLVQALALGKITSGEVGIIFATAPAITLIISSIFIKETSSTLQKIGVGISISGVILLLILSGTSISLNFGYIWALLSALTFSIYNTHARVVLKSYKFFEVTEVLLIIGAIFYNVLAVLLVNDYFTPFESTSYLLGIIYIGTLASVLASLSANYALTSITAAQLTIFTNLATLISITAGALVLSEPVRWYHFVSTVLIISGVTLANKKST